MKICEANQDKNISRVNGKKQILIFYFSTIQINHVELAVFKTFDPPLRKREEEGRGGREVATTEIY